MAEAATQSPFVAQLARQMRAADALGRLDKKGDEEVLAQFVVDRAARRRIPIIGDPDPGVIARLELYYDAAALAIEHASGTMVTPVLKLHPEGFGRVILAAGRLIVYSRHHRDVHRFGFDSIAALAQKGDEIVAASLALLQRYPEVAAQD